MKWDASWLQHAERWRPIHVEPLRLRCWVSSPIGWDLYAPLTIEGLLQFVVVWESTNASPDDVFAECPNNVAIDTPIPIADVDICGHLIACASNAVVPSSFVEDVRYRRKRPDVDMYAGRRIAVSGGWAKALSIACPTVVTPYVDFFVRGDASMLRALLKHPACVGIGRDTVRGLGTILGWEVDADPHDRSLLHNGAPQRVLPLMNDGVFATSRMRVGSFTRRYQNTRAPYWRGNQSTLCVIPVGLVDT